MAGFAGDYGASSAFVRNKGADAKAGAGTTNHFHAAGICPCSIDLMNVGGRQAWQRPGGGNEIVYQMHGRDFQAILQLPGIDRPTRIGHHDMVVL